MIAPSRSPRTLPRFQTKARSARVCQDIYTSMYTDAYMHAYVGKEETPELTFLLRDKEYTGAPP